MQRRGSALIASVLAGTLLLIALCLFWVVPPLMLHSQTLRFLLPSGMPVLNCLLERVEKPTQEKPLPIRTSSPILVAVVTPLR